MFLILAMNVEGGGSQFKASPLTRPYLKNKVKEKRSGSMIEVVE
jgi:hypothetical protein